MITSMVRPQRNVVGFDGGLHKAWEFVYHKATFYIQETGTGYAVVEETPYLGSWRPVGAQRQRMILAEFERAKGKARL
jgi:hypothetical protein